MRLRTRESLSVFAGSMFVLGVFAVAAGFAIEATDNDGPEPNPRVVLGIDDFAHLGEGVVFIGNQDCPPSERPIADGETIVYEFRDGGVQGFLFSISPEAVYQSVHAPAIFCGSDAGLGNPFEGNAIVIAGANTAYSQG